MRLVQRKLLKSGQRVNCDWTDNIIIYTYADDKIMEAHKNMN